MCIRDSPQASLTQWSYSYDGFPKDFEWTPNGCLLYTSRCV